MKVIMTKRELERAVAAYQREMGEEDSFVRPDPTSPSGWSFYIALRHYDTTIPIHLVEEEKRWLV